MPDFIIKSGDTLPILQDTLTYSDGSSVNLTGASVQFLMRAATAANTQINAAAVVTNPTSPATVQYTFQAADTSGTYGQYLASWLVTFAGGTTMNFPTDGYLSIWVEPNLSDPSQHVVGLAEVKTHLRLPASDRTHDARLLEMIDAARPVIEGITGPILSTPYIEEYDGGQWFIQLRHRPVLEIQQVVEYRGPIPYNLTQVPTPDLGTIYSYQVDPPLARIVRRTVGGGITPFPPGANQVIVTYTAGYQYVPANVREAALELVRENFQQTEMAQHSGFGTSGGMRDDEEPGGPAIGFYMTPRVRELLSPNKRAPSVA